MIGIVITMYDESDIVVQTIKNCSNSHQYAKFVVVHSFNGIEDENLEFIKRNTVYIPMSNLAKELTRDEIGSAAICRNYNAGFKRLYEIGVEYDLVIGMTGDTLIKDLSRIIAITSPDHIGYVLQAKGQPFYDRNDRPGIDQPSRWQSEEVNDIMPQFFVFNGRFAYDNKLFTEIFNVNRFTSEENLGNEIVRAVGDQFKQMVKRIHENPNVYDYHDGIEFQLKGLGHTRKNL
jgi:hypothetical protein